MVNLNRCLIWVVGEYNVQIDIQSLKYFQMSRSNQGHEYYITVFSPEGKLYQVEYAFKAVKTSGLTSIGVRGKDSVVLLTEKRISDRFIDPESVTNIYNVSPKVGCLTTGLAPDARNIVTRLRYEAAGFKYEFGHDIPVDFLASRLADYNQTNTQKAMQRVFGVEAIIAGIDEEKGPALFKIDPSGFYAGYKAVSSGVKEQDAINAMEKQSKKKGWDLSQDQAIKMAITTMQTIMGQEFKSTDLELGVVSVEHPNFRKLTVDEIEKHLNDISQKD